MKSYHVYMVKCSDGTLYTGMTSDLRMRVIAHNTLKTGARYTKARRPVTLVYAKPCKSAGDALKKEYAIKRLTRKQKMLLIAAK